MGNSKSLGITPTTVKLFPLRLMDRPTTSVADPKIDCHRSWLSITDWTRGFSSSALKSRPSAGLTPRIRKKSEATTCPSKCRGSPPPVSANDLPWYDANPENDLFCARQSKKSAELIDDPV